MCYFIGYRWEPRPLYHGDLIDQAVNIQEMKMEENPEADLVAYDSNRPNVKMCYNHVAAPGFMYLLRHYKQGICAGIAPIALFFPNPPTPTEMMVLCGGANLKLHTALSMIWSTATTIRFILTPKLPCWRQIPFCQ